MALLLPQWISIRRRNIRICTITCADASQFNEETYESARTIQLLQTFILVIAEDNHGLHFMPIVVGLIDWRPNPNDLSNNMCIGKYGSCCSEMYIWDANSMATAFMPHTCGVEGKWKKVYSLFRSFKCLACVLTCYAPIHPSIHLFCHTFVSSYCVSFLMRFLHYRPVQVQGHRLWWQWKGQWYDGVCDKDGCDINTYSMGNPNFYGRWPQYTVHTTKPMKVVTPAWPQHLLRYDTTQYNRVFNWTIRK